MTCGLSYSLSLPTPTQTLRTTTYVWMAVTAEAGCRALLRVYAAPAAQPGCLKELGILEVADGPVRGLLYVPGDGAGWGPQVWAAVAGERSLVVYAAR